MVNPVNFKTYQELEGVGSKHVLLEGPLQFPVQFGLTTGIRV